MAALSRIFGEPTDHASQPQLLSGVAADEQLGAAGQEEHTTLGSVLFQENRHASAQRSP